LKLKLKTAERKTSMRKHIIAGLVAVSFVVSGLAIAQQALGPNGGMLAGRKGHETELVVSATELTIYMIDHGKPHTTKGVSLRAVVQDGGKTTQIPMVDVKNEKLVGALPAPLSKGAIVVISGKDDHGAAVSARYTVK
jgi:hypothetical protein